MGKNIRNKTTLLRIYTIVWIIVCIGIFLMAYHGYLMDSTKQIGASDALYKSLKIFTFGDDSFPVNNSWVNIARFLGPFVMLGGGLPIILSLFGSIWRCFCLMTYSNHTIIFGYDDIGKVIEKQRISNREKVIIIDSNIDEKVRINEIYFQNDEKSHLKDEELLLRARVKKASKIFVVTDSDYRNLSIYNQLVNDLNVETDKIHVRLEQLNYKAILPISGFTPSMLAIDEILHNKNENNEKSIDKTDKETENKENELIIVVGLGQVGKKIVDEYKDKHYICIFEQSQDLINRAKDDLENDNNIHYYRTDVRFLVETDLKKVLNSIKLHKKMDSIESISIFIALGGDWLSYKIALDWRTWLVLKEFHTTINIVANNLDYRLFELQEEKKTLVKVRVYNIHHILNKKNIFATNTKKK